MRERGVREGEVTACFTSTVASAGEVTLRKFVERKAEYFKRGRIIHNREWAPCEIFSPQTGAGAAEARHMVR